MLLGHIAVASVAKQTIFPHRNFAFLMVASFIPDFIDKPAQIFLHLPGRGIGHSLIMFFAGASIALALSHRLKLPNGLIPAALVMWFAHLAGDFLEWHVLLWPFYRVPVAPHLPFNLGEKLYQFYIARMWPEQFWLEMICITAAVVFTLRSYRMRALFHRR